VIGEPTIEKDIDEALKAAAKVVKRFMNANTRRDCLRAARSAQRLTMAARPIDLDIDGSFRINHFRPDGSPASPLRSSASPPASAGRPFGPYSFLLVLPKG
jgi:hypothetical protein